MIGTNEATQLQAPVLSELPERAISQAGPIKVAKPADI
jgi:hypothetical protein